MARANLPAPETISGERSYGTPTADLQPKARPFSTFKNPVGLNIPDAPQENSLSQLGAALSRFNPTLQNLAVQQVQLSNEENAATASVHQAKWAAVNMEYADAVKAGLIPAGASPAYHSAYKSKELDSKQLRFAPKLHANYEASGLKDSDDPQAMQTFLAKEVGDYRAASLMKDGSDRYTPLEIANSKFDENLQGHVNSLMAQHIQYRTQERTRVGKEIAGQNVGLYIEKFYDASDPNSHIAAAKAIIESVYGPTGIGTHGITKQETNNLVVDAIATKMVEMGDENVGLLAKYIGTSQGNNLAGGTYAKNKFKEASDAIMTNKIRQANWNWTERERHANEGEGVTPESEAARKAKLWKEHDAAQQRQLQDLHNKDTSDHTKAQSSAAVSYILKGLDLRDMVNPYVKKSFDWLRDNDTSAWMTMTSYVNSYKKEKTAFHDSPASELAAAKLRYEMSRDPLGFDASRIMASANSGTINPSKVQTLMDDWDKARVHQDNPFMQNPGFTKLVEDLRKVAVKDMADQYGPGAINAMKVEQQMRTNAYDWIAKNPQGSYLDFIKEMRAQAEPLAQDFSPQFAEDEKVNQQKKVNPKPVPQKDTRSTMEKVLPNAMGGKPKPQPVTPAPTGPIPLKPSEAFTAMNPEAYQLVKKMMLDPETDDMELEAAIYNSGLWAFMKSNGRTPAEFKALKDDLIKLRKK